MEFGPGKFVNDNEGQTFGYYFQNIKLQISLSLMHYFLFFFRRSTATGSTQVTTYLAFIHTLYIQAAMNKVRDKWLIFANKSSDDFKVLLVVTDIFRLLFWPFLLPPLSLPLSLAILSIRSRIRITNNIIVAVQDQKKIRFSRLAVGDGLIMFHVISNDTAISGMFHS